MVNPANNKGPSRGTGAGTGKLDPAKSADAAKPAANDPAADRATPGGPARISRQDRQTFGVQGNRSAMRLDERAFKRLDRNGDGQLSGAEIRKQQVGMDLNGDKSVSKEEFMLARGQRRAEVQMQQLDRNRDGVLSGREIHKSIAGADENKDGRVTKAELERFHTRNVDPSKLFDGMDANKDGALSGTEAEGFKDKGYDADGDGRITKPEFLAARERERKEARFADADGNKDGVLSGNEVTAERKDLLDTDRNGSVSKEEYLAGPEDVPVQGTDGPGAGVDADGRQAAERRGAGVDNGQGNGVGAGRGIGAGRGNGAGRANGAAGGGRAAGGQVAGAQRGTNERPVARGGNQAAPQGAGGGIGNGVGNGIGDGVGDGIGGGFGDGREPAGATGGQGTNQAFNRGPVGADGAAPDGGVRQDLPGQPTGAAGGTEERNPAPGDVAAIRQRFEALDTNKDGFLSAEEMGVGGSTGIDRDKDARVSLDEFQADAGKTAALAEPRVPSAFVVEPEVVGKRGEPTEMGFSLI